MDSEKMNAQQNDAPDERANGAPDTIDSPENTRPEGPSDADPAAAEQAEGPSDLDLSLDDIPEAETFSLHPDGEGEIPPSDPNNPYDPALPPDGAEPPQDLDWKPIYDDGETPPPDRPKKKHRGLIIALVVLICLLLAAGGAAAAGGYYVLKDGGAYEEELFFVNTWINGIDCSGMTVDEVYDAITEEIGTYTLTIVERDGEETITGTEIDLAERPDRDAIQALLDEQNEADRLTLIRQYFNTYEAEIELICSYDEEKAAACVDALTCLDTDLMTAPVDSELVRGDDGYYITESVLGTTLDAEEARAVIEAALENLEETVDLEALGLYTSPTVTETDENLTSQLAQIELLTSACITYDLSDRTYVCDAGVIIDFLIQDEEGNWTVDEDLVHAWVDQMADETDTYQNHTFVTHSGSTVSLPNGNYGWKLYRDTTTADLIEYITTGTVITTEPNYYKKNAKTRATNDIGDDYVEIDIDNQMVYLYVDGECILETACVTGLASDSDRATPSWGVWALSYKATNQTLGTLEVQGYESFVYYWMPFNGGVGLHDATWRSSFGGTIYKTNGSHGCVNLPLAAAKTIYETISAGWPIIVYGD